MNWRLKYLLYFLKLLYQILLWLQVLYNEFEFLKCYANYLNLEYKQYIIKKTSERTFIDMDKNNIIKKCDNKFKYDEKIKGKNIIIVDDTIVRGNIIKSIIKHLKFNKALYFSRSPIPYGSREFFEHIGIYAYKINTLKKFVSLKMGKLEKIESLEQLRALENGIEIIVGKVKKAPYSIDTPKDLKFFLKNELYT